ncbi:helix-turn-helix domain-containing protein [Actinomadura oligospora]|uniref:helix-turn-helix domain-containing protein n=1 Tax=Actinomadura oligospora TaxID=111804 RepID=UPI0004B832B1|nr:helix-turn-helix transcriptional regulator [Actinomadura oligospora]
MAGELSKLRKATGHTREEVAEHVGVAPSTITRFENATASAPAMVVAAMLDLYGVDGAEKDMWVMVAKQARRRGWWSRFGAVIPDWFKFYIGLEEEASAISSYQPEAIFGLLQTERYMRGLTAEEIGSPSDEELDRRVRLRLKRQERLTRPDAPKLWIILSEAAIRREVGGPDVMSEQLRHLAEMASPTGSVIVQVLTFTAGAHPAMDGPFTILGFPESQDPDVVYVQSRTGGLYLEEPTHVEEYTDIFNHLRARALSPEESREMIVWIADEMSARSA